jgi:uncharacterized membrane protein
VGNRHASSSNRTTGKRSAGSGRSISANLNDFAQRDQAAPASPADCQKPPQLATERTGLNDKVANVIAKTVGSMWMSYASIAGFAVWMAGLGAIVAGDRYPFDLMLLAVGGIMQWLAMIAILVAQNAQGNVQDKQVEHLHRLGVTTHKLVVENTELTEAIHDHLIKNGDA